MTPLQQALEKQGFDAMGFKRGSIYDVDACSPVPQQVPLEPLYSLAKIQAALESVSGWVALADSEWMNIVNHSRCYENYSKEEAVHHAVKMTEAKLKELNAATDVSAQSVNGELLAALRDAIECGDDGDYQSCQRILRDVIQRAESAKALQGLADEGQRLGMHGDKRNNCVLVPCDKLKEMQDHIQRLQTAAR